MSTNTIAPLIELALCNGGIAFMLVFAVNSRIKDLTLTPLFATMCSKLVSLPLSGRPTASYR